MIDQQWQNQPGKKEDRYAYVSIGGKQYTYWLFLESKIVHPQALEIDTEPLDEVIVWRN